jgi:hypothetical protein
MTNATNSAYQNAIAAEQAWIDELKATYGPRAYPDCRYDKRSTASSELASLYATWRAAMVEWLPMLRDTTFADVTQSDPYATFDTPTPRFNPYSRG